jgi:hypothetical protein
MLFCSIELGTLIDHLVNMEDSNDKENKQDEEDKEDLVSVDESYEERL